MYGRVSGGKESTSFFYGYGGASVTLIWRLIFTLLQWTQRPYPLQWPLLLWAPIALAPSKQEAVSDNISDDLTGVILTSCVWHNNESLYEASIEYVHIFWAFVVEICLTLVIKLQRHSFLPYIYFPDPLGRFFPSPSEIDSAARPNKEVAWSRMTHVLLFF